eukprot:GDKJ01026232.1.p1 GENE.GDKJ01026232.1~~GDKJ01026232.1.p1  ORF type:complete len:156 (+),score=8.14 GDKJ01026232.1:147-614(+)
MVPFYGLIYLILSITLCRSQIEWDDPFSAEFSGEFVELSRLRSSGLRSTARQAISSKFANPYNSETYDMTWKPIIGSSPTDDFFLAKTDQFRPRWTLLTVEVPPIFFQGLTLYSPLFRRIQRFKVGVHRAVKTQVGRSASRTQLKLQKLVSGTCC